MILKNRYLALFIAGATLFAVGCKDDSSPSSSPKIPSSYSSDDYIVNTADERNLYDELNALVAELEALESSSVAVPVGDLTAFWEGTSMKNQVNPAFEVVVDNYLLEAAEASGNQYDSLTGEGGVLAGRLFNEHGVEPLEMVEKGLFGALFYNRAIELATTYNEADLCDKLIALYGAHPIFANTSNHPENPDRGPAKYSARRTPMSGGFYLDIKSHLIQANYYLSRGNTRTDAVVAEPLAAVLATWERFTAATIINYLHSTIGTLSQTNLSPEDQASALHAYSEAVGFARGLLVVSNRSIASNTQLNEVLTAMLYSIENSSYTGNTLLTDRVSGVQSLTNALNLVKNIYGFTDDEVNQFRMNWINEEQR